MRRSLAKLLLAGVLVLAAASPSLACKFAPGTKPPTHVTNEPTVFVGTVTATSRKGATFRVEAVGRGDPGKTYEIAYKTDCDIYFELGQRYLFGGAFLMSLTHKIGPDEPAEAVLAGVMP